MIKCLVKEFNANVDGELSVVVGFAIFSNYVATLNLIVNL